jgi:hypothetical protein
LELRYSYEVYVLRILILGNTRGEKIARLKNFGDQVIAVEEKTSGAVEPANLPKEWHRPQSEENREFAS